MAEQCGERDIMITIKGLMRQKNKPVGEQYYLVVENCKFDGNNVWIYEEDLLAMLEKLIKVINSPTMRNVDYSELYKLTNKLQEKLQEKCEVQDKDNKGGSRNSGIRGWGNNIKEVGSNTLGVIKNIGNPKKAEIEQNPETMVEPSDEKREEAKRKMAELKERQRQEEQKKEEQRCKDWFLAERELAEEKAKYSKAKRIEQIFNGKVQPMVQPFLKLMESLIYFAGCLNAEDFSTRKRILSNRQQLLCSNLQASTWGFSLDREAFQGVDEMLAAMSQETKLPELPQIPDRLTAEEYLQEKQETEKLKRQYLLENEKLRLNDFRQKQILEYICLFRELYPVVVKICAESQTDIEEQWAISIGREIVRIVDQHQSRNESMKFIFVYPDNEAHTQNESVKIDFIAAEADCPGLYYRDSSGELICVIPGRVK